MKTKSTWNISDVEDAISKRIAKRIANDIDKEIISQLNTVYEVQPYSHIYERLQKVLNETR